MAASSFSGGAFSGIVRLSLAGLTGLLSTAALARPLAFDLNADGVVGAADLSALLGAIGRPATPLELQIADSNADGALSMADVEDLVEAWGASASGADAPEGSMGVIEEGARLPVTPPPPPPPPPPSVGWTTLTASPDTVAIYVSAAGNDSNNGLSPAAPLRTIAAGVAKLRNGKPDWLLLKAGDTWNTGLGTWTKSGRSLTEPMVIGVYGATAVTSRARLRTGTSAGFQMTSSSGVSYLSMIGISMTPEAYTGTQRAQGFRWVGPGRGLLIEDCEIVGFQTNIAIQGQTIPMRDVKIRRNIIADSFAIGDHSQGIYMSDVDGILIEENVLDHNGWKTGVVGAEQTIFNHNIYLTKDTTSATTVRGNISANASSHGMQLRRGGLCENNLLIGNPINILFGQFQSAWPSQAATGTISRNVVIDSRNIGTQSRGHGIWLQMANGVTVSENVIAHQENGGSGLAIYADYNYQNVNIDRNVVHRWAAPTGGGAALRFQGTATGLNRVRWNTFSQTNSARISEHLVAIPAGVFSYQQNRYTTNAASSGWFHVNGSNLSLATWLLLAIDVGSVSGPGLFPDPLREVETYNATLGGPATEAAFIVEARKQSKANWRTQYTAAGANAWIRAGYGLN